MSDVQTAEFLRLIKVSFDISLNALKGYANEKLIKPCYGDSLIRFLDRKKHFFYHKWQSKVSCCNCSTFVSQKKELHDWIFYKLYAITPGIKCNRQSNLSQVNRVKHQHCLCRIISHQNLSLNDLDVSVICFLLKNCGHSNLLINQIDDIAKVRNILCHPEKGSKSFSKAEYADMWKTLENSILSLAKEIGVFYWESVKDHLATIKKHGVDLDDVIHHLKDIKEFNTKMKQEATDHMQKVNDSILSVQAELTAKGEEQTLEIQRSISESTASVLDGQQDVLENIHGIQTVVKYNASEMNKKMKQEATDHMQKVNDSMLSVQAKLTAKGGEQTLEIQRSISESTANVLDGQQDILEKVHGIQTAVNYNASEINKVTSEGLTHVTKVADHIIHETGKETKEIVLSLKDEIVGGIKTEIRMFFRELKREEDNSSETEAERKIKVSSQVNSKVWNKKKTLENLNEIVKAEMKDDDPDNFHIETAEEKCIQLELTAHPDVFKSAEKLRSAIIKLNRRLLEAGEVDTYKAGTMTLDLIVNTPLTEEEKTVVYKLFTESGSSENAFDTKDVKSNLTTIWKEDISRSDTTVTRGDLVVNITDVLGKMVKKEAVETHDLDKMKYEHVSTSFGKKEMNISTLQCKSCGGRFPCENCKNYINTIPHLLKIERLPFGEQPEKTLEKRKGLTRKLEDNDEQKEPELKKRKTYTEDLTGDHQSEKVTTDLTSTEDSAISFDINETLKKLGKLKLIDLKIDEGEKQREKLLGWHQYHLYHFEGSMWSKHVSDLLDDLKMLRKYRLRDSDNLLQEFSYQRKQNAAGTEDLDFLDKNFGLQCNFCLTQNKEDLPGRCKTCSEILCNKCLVQHHVDHRDHSYDYADDILHGYKKTTDPISVKDVVVDIKCLTIDTLVIVRIDMFGEPLTLSIYDLIGKLLTTKPTRYGKIWDAKLTVIDPTTVAVSIPSDAVLIANYINPVINTKEIKTSPGMTGGIASIKNILYLAYKTGIKVYTLTGEEITSINIPDITLLYTVSNWRLLCVYNRNCGQSKTMGYIDIMNNSLLPLDKLPFHPSSVTVDNGGNILFVEDGNVLQAKSDGSDCKIIISANNIFHFDGIIKDKECERVCFNAHSNLLIVAGGYGDISVFRKVGDEID